MPHQVGVTGLETWLTTDGPKSPTLGYRVAIADFVPSGKFDHVKGRRSRFAEAVARQRTSVAAAAASGATPTVVEPAIALLHGHEYPASDPHYPRTAVRSIAELLLDRVDQVPSTGTGRRVRLLGHCTERTTASTSAGAWVEVLSAAGFDVEAPAIGCCGMAGIFGHEAANQQMSRRIWDLSWARQVAVAASEVEVVATGYSCRSQAKRFGPVTLRHPLELLAEVLTARAADR